MSPQEKLDMILQYRLLVPLIPLSFFPSSLMWVNTTSCALIITFCIFLTRCVLVVTINENVLLFTSWKSGIHLKPMDLADGMVFAIMCVHVFKYTTCIYTHAVYKSMEGWG